VKKTTLDTKNNVPLDNVRHELFCQYMTGGEETFDNGTKSYAFAYEIDYESLSKDDAKYEIQIDKETGKPMNVCVEKSSFAKAELVCAVNASKLLRTAKIKNRITKLMSLMLTEEFVDGELLYVAKQRRELSPKVAAIKEFNALKGRVVQKNALTDAQGKDLIPDNTSLNKAADAITKFLNGRDIKNNSKRKS